MLQKQQNPIIPIMEPIIILLIKRERMQKIIPRQRKTGHIFTSK
jgi:hypothetical protein